MDEESDCKNVAGSVSGRQANKYVHKNHFLETHRFLEAQAKKKDVVLFTFSYVCEHCKLFPVEDFMSWVSATHGEKEKEDQNLHEWLVVWSLRNAIGRA